MDISKMTCEELKELQKTIKKELYTRNKDAYDELEHKIISLIEDFELEKGLYVGFDMGDYEDTAINVIKAYMYYSTEYIESYE